MNNNDKPKINPENINEKSNNEFGFKEAISFNDEKKINPKKMKKVKFCDLSIDMISKKKKERLKLKFQ